MEQTSNNLILGRYQAIENIGQGGYGKVIHAYDTRLKREVAIKELVLVNANNLADNADEGVDALESIPGLDEARAAGKLNDSNIVAIYDCVVEDNKVYVIEEYVEGITLTKLLRLLDDSITLDIISAVFRGVSHAIMVAHKKNLLHLDIKPDNVIIGRGGEVKVADFGLATLMDINGEGKANAGTIGYMPLEQIEQKPLDVRSDEWSLAMLTYFMLSGNNPFVTAKTPTQAEELMQSAELTCPSACWEGLDEGIDDVVFKALALVPDERYQTVKDFVDELKPYLGKQAQGKREIATIVNGNDDAVVDTSTIMLDDSAPNEVRRLYPFVDRVGRRGFRLIMKMLSILSACLISAFALINIRLDISQSFGVLTGYPFVFAVLVAVPVVLTLFKTHFASMYAFVLLCLTLLYNKCYILGIIMLVATCLLFAYMRKRLETNSFLCLIAPIFGGIGLGCVTFALAGALLNKKDAILTSLFVGLTMFIFACFGSGNLLNWEVAGNYLLPANADIASANINGIALKLVQSPQTYLTLVFLIVASVVFSLFCSFGKVGFDIAGAVFCGAMLLTSAILPDQLLGDQTNALNVVNALVGIVVAIFCATLKICDRVRVDKAEW